MNSLFRFGPALLASAAGASAAIVNLSAAADNTLYESPTGSLSNGQGPTFFVGNTGGNLIRRGLIKFDLAPLPAGAIIDSAALKLFLVQAQSFPVQVDVHRVLAAWGEGASATGFRGGGGATAQPGDATWIHAFYPSSFWATPGGDFVASPSASTEVSAEGSIYTWSGTPALMADVQSWINDPALNYGWLLTGDETQGGTAKAFGTREEANAAHHSMLTLSFHLGAVPEPGTVAWGACVALFAASRRIRSGRAGEY